MSNIYQLEISGVGFDRESQRFVRWAEHPTVTSKLVKLKPPKNAWQQSGSKVTPSEGRSWPQVMDVADVAEYLQVSRRFIYDRTSPTCPPVDRIPHTKIGKFVRFRLAEIERWLANNDR